MAGDFAAADRFVLPNKALMAAASNMSDRADPVLLEAPSWTAKRWVGWVSGVFVLQLVLIFWLSDRTPVRSRPVKSQPTLQVTGPTCSEWLGLVDPTLFALPHRESFSGPAWLNSLPADLPDHDRGAVQRLAPELLSRPRVAFSELPRLALVDSPAPLRRAWPEVEMGAAAPQGFLPDQSRWRLDGDLVGRRLLSDFKLPSWPSPNGDLLTNTIVQLAVNDAGFAELLTLLSSSGSVEADQRALELARNARFEPLRELEIDSVTQPAQRLNWGQIIFCWHTLAQVPTTNSIPAGPKP